jgi:TolB-like protein
MDQRVELAQAGAFALGPHTVNPPTLEVVTARGRKVLERRIMQVLVALARADGEVVSRDELLASCWSGRIVGEDALYRAVAVLRKFSAEVGGFTIETVGGVGYRLVGAGLRDPEPRTIEAPRPDTVDERAIAVLPFANLSPDPDQTYFADGLTEEFICQLARVAGLKVACRTASFAFKGDGHDLRAIGQSLGVAYVLEGSVRRSGQRLRISARLADCAEGFDLWSQTYDRDQGDIFAIQEEIAGAVVGALSVALGVASPGLDYGGTRSFEAYDQFLKAGRIWHFLSSHELGDREAHLRRAVAIDPDYGLAWATLACLISHRRGFLPATEAPRIERDRLEAADRALKLAPELPESQIALACIEADKRNWRAADESCRRAVKGPIGLNPQAETIAGSYFSVTGRFAEGLPYKIAGRDFDPLSVGYACLVLFSYHALERWEAFDAEYERTRDLHGDRLEIEFARLLRLLLANAGDNVIADQYDRMLTLGPDPLFSRLAEAHGAREEVGLVLRSHGETLPWRVFKVARVAGAYGHPDIAMAALRAASPQAPSGQFSFMWCPEFRATRQRPEFKQLVRDIGMAQFWRETGRWPDCCRPLGEDDLEFV